VVKLVGYLSGLQPKTSADGGDRALDLESLGEHGLAARGANDVHVQVDRQARNVEYEETERRSSLARLLAQGFVAGRGVQRCSDFDRRGVFSIQAASTHRSSRRSGTTARHHCHDAACALAGRMRLGFPIRLSQRLEKLNCDLDARVGSISLPLCCVSDAG